MRKRTKERIKGSITVLLVIILVPMMTLSAIIVDYARVNMTRSMLSSAGDLAMNSALADYDTILKDVYGLFAMSQGKSSEELATSIRDYFVKTISSYGSVTNEEAGDYVDSLIGDFKELISGTSEDSKDFSNFLKVPVDSVSFEVDKIKNSSLANPEILRTQIVEYMKYRAPVSFGLSFLDSLKSFKNVEKQTEVVQKQVKAQESVQDVTNACSESIKAIRDYDKLFDSIISGDKAVKGSSNRNDGVIVHVKDYNTQVDKYRDAWGVNREDSYSHINKLNLVFLLKSPSVDSVYLKNLNYVDANARFLVKNSDNTYTFNYDNSGISVQYSLQQSLDSSKQQLINQINKLNSGAENNTARAYSNKFLYREHTAENMLSFNTEEQAINAFMSFERVLLDDASATIKYSDVKNALEQVYVLGRYYDNYNTYATNDINNARAAMDEANNAVNNASANANSYKNNVTTYINKINNANKDFRTKYDFLSGKINSRGKDLKSLFDGILAQNNVSLPTALKYSGDKQFIDFSGFVNSTYKESSGDADTKYVKLIKDICNSSIGSDSAYQNLCSAVNDFYDKTKNRTNKTFEQYVTNKCGNGIKSNDLYKIFSFLNTNNEYVSNIISNINSYDSIYNNYNGLVRDAQQKTASYNSKVADKNNVDGTYRLCLSNPYEAFINNYQNDAYYYNRYIETAKTIVTAESGYVNTQFSAIKDNIKSLVDQLQLIYDNLDTAKTQITTYNTNLDEWKSSNDSYASAADQDNFSKQNDAEIAKSKSQYDIKSLETLMDCVNLIKEEYQSFYDRLTDQVHYKYGSKKVYEISNYDNLKNAVSSVVDQLPAIVSVEDATRAFTNLYNGEPTDRIETMTGAEEQWHFLKPTLVPNQFLRYLNSAYPDPETNQEKENADTVQVGNESIENFNYKDQKSQLNNNSGKDVETGNDNKGKYGYTYSNDDRVVDDFVPTKIQSEFNVPKSVNTDSMKISSGDDDKVNASDGLGKQKDALSSILGGLGDTVENLLEKVYILSYIFNDFSYNTMIQDAVMSDNKNKSIDSLLEAQNLLCGDLSAYENKCTTLSNVPINSDHNFFYGAEIEYILFGNSSAANNVKYTKASIYAVRFVFNCIYAFTNNEIKTTTMAVGLAVQAATLGIVPYQVVQIVLQLVLAAAESAIDLSKMNCGLKVAVVKTEETWSLSLSNAVKKAGEYVANVVSEEVKKGIQSISSGLQGVVDSSAEGLKESVENLKNDLTDATQGKAKEILDAAFGLVQSKVEEVLNDLQYYNYDEENALDPLSLVNEKFGEIKSTITSEIEEKFSGNPIAERILPTVNSKVTALVDNFQAKVTETLQAFSPEQMKTEIVNKMNSFKSDLNSKINEAVDTVFSDLAETINSFTDDVRNEINGYIQGVGDDLSEKAADTIKEKVTNATNDFVSGFLDSGSDAISDNIEGGIGGSTGSSVASMIKFGYKDYLMLFTFIAICANEKAVLARTGDMIEMNVKKAVKGEDSGAWYEHSKKGDFKLSEARAYVRIDATVKLNMLFFNLDFFSSQVNDETTSVDDDFKSGATLHYYGIYGY